MGSKEVLLRNTAGIARYTRLVPIFTHFAILNLSGQVTYFRLTYLLHPISPASASSSASAFLFIKHKINTPPRLRYSHVMLIIFFSLSLSRILL